MWQQLEDGITQLIDDYEQLLALGKKKKAVLVLVDFKGLDAVLKEEQQLVARIGSSEKKRQIILRELAKTQTGISADSKMADLYDACPRQMAEVLKARHEKLSRLVQAAATVREENAFLVSAALSAVEYHLNVLGDAKVTPVYGSNGSEQIFKNKKFDFEA